MTCPSCARIIVELKGGEWRLAFPRSVSRTPLSSDVPEKFASDYREACLVFADSPKACAALSRRCLQNVLRDAGGFTQRDLVDQIQAAIDARLPSYVTGLLDAVRVVGNFAAHPIKSRSSGEIIDVEPGEAETLLDTLETCFDFYFIQAANAQRKRDAINAKLAEAGKPPLR